MEAALLAEAVLATASAQADSAEGGALVSGAGPTIRRMSTLVTLGPMLLSVQTDTVVLLEGNSVSTRTIFPNRPSSSSTLRRSVMQR